MIHLSEFSKVSREIEASKRENVNARRDEILLRS
jgi:hypothetical protein